jgi:hypothetical protein
MIADSPTTKADRWLAVALALGTFLVLWATQRSVGYVRDEGYYFSAGQSYEQWFVELGQDFAHGRFLEPFRDATIVRYWSNNHEHPVFVKTLFALSHLFLHEKLRWLDDSTAYRFPAFLLAGVLTWALFWLGRPFGRSVAVLAPLLFWAVPRHFFNGHLACFDMPVVMTWCLFFLAYARAVETGRGAWWAGAAFGLALATKHNAFFLPLAVLAHWAVMDFRAVGTEVAERARAYQEQPHHAALKVLAPIGVLIRVLFSRVPRPIWAMAWMGPLILYVHWPYLWHHPIDRVAWWIGFHTNHINYPWQYFGTVLRDPPFPVLYPVTLEALTVPAATVVAIAIGCVLVGVRALGSFSKRVESWAGQATSREWLLLIGGLAAITPFMTTKVPIFGGVKHWMSAMAVASLFAAGALAWIGRMLVSPRGAAVTAALGGLVLAPACWATAHFHPFGTSAYNEIAGGAAGGAELGFQRQFWSNNVTAALGWINRNAPQGASVYFHEVNPESFQAYQENGYLRRDIRYASGPHDAVIVSYEYHQEFRGVEFETWNEFGTRVPVASFAIDEAPQVVVYARPGLKPAPASTGLRRISH